MRVPVKNLPSGLSTSTLIPSDEVMYLGDYVEDLITQHIEVGDFNVTELVGILSVIDDLLVSHVKYYPEQHLIFRD